MRPDPIDLSVLSHISRADFSADAVSPEVRLWVAVLCRASLDARRKGRGRAEDRIAWKDGRAFFDDGRAMVVLEAIGFTEERSRWIIKMLAPWRNN